MLTVGWLYVSSVHMSRPKIHYGSELTETQISENYEMFISYLKEVFSGKRLDGLLEMYKEENLGTQLALAPAAGKVHFHYAHTGGYIQHIFNVDRASAGAMKLYEAMSGTIDWSEEERIFSALHHDLGKLGDETGPYYVPQHESWAIEKRGEVFKHNSKNQFWNVTDRALYNLQKYGVVVTWKETLAIKLSDGLYDESNATYLKTFNPDNALRTNLPYIIHSGDFLACHAEYDQWKREQ